MVMKHVFCLILAVTILIPAFWGCKGSGKDDSGFISGEMNFDKDASYALGMNIGSSMVSDGLVPDLNEVLQGMKDSLSGATTRLSEEEARTKFQMAFLSLMESKSGEAIQKENEFLAENSKKPGIIITASGLQYEVIVEGNGPMPNAEDTVKVNYEGKLINGTVFDSSYTWGMPVEYPLRGFIPGWIEGVQLMPVGSKYKFYIPSELAYGSNGNGPIPPYSALIFEIELVDIIK